MKSTDKAQNKLMLIFSLNDRWWIYVVVAGGHNCTR